MDNTSQLIAAAFTVLTIAVLLVLVRKKKRTETRLGPLAGVVTAFSILNLYFSEDRWLVFGIIGFVILFVAIDAIKKRRDS